MIDILMVIKTSGLEYDDRLRKECVSLHNLGRNPIIIALTDSNKSECGLTDYKIPFQLLSLSTRKIFKHRVGLFFKLLEMYVRFIYLILLKRPQILWIHDIEMIGLVPFGWLLKKLGIIDKLIWDQHELPPPTASSNSFKRFIFRYILNMCNAVIIANRERRDYVLMHFGINNVGLFHVLENFVDKAFASKPKGILPDNLARWLNNEPYMIALGGANPGRYIDELVEAIEHFKNIKLVIVGPYESNVIKNLQKRWGKKLDDFCYFTGYIPQCFMVNYIDDAMASIVLYNYDTDNNKYCAPNRLYQSAARGIPLIVGANPTMANFLNNYKCGVILHDDGRDVNSIRIGVKKMLDNFSMYKNHAVTIRDKNIVTWESQIMVFKKLLNL